MGEGATKRWPLRWGSAVRIIRKYVKLIENVWVDKVREMFRVLPAMLMVASFP
jgi:hypothetical protein